MNKKAQAQIITTVLIILLVLAAIVIVWQVIQGTIESGTEEISKKTGCLGLNIDITNINTQANAVTIRPNKEIEGFRVYVDGNDAGESPVKVPELGTKTYSVTRKYPPGIKAGNEVEVLGKIAGEYCTIGSVKKKAP